MADWVLIPCLKVLFAEFDRIAPSRDHASDGSIGNTAHQNEVSDHNPDETGKVPIHDADRVNEVHAIDVDNNLRAGDLTMEVVVQFLLARCRSGAEKRLRYIIYNRRIWSASSGWVQKTYTGPSPHTEHAHFSGSYETKLEASTASWHLEDLVALDSADIKAIWTTDGIIAAPSNATSAVTNPQWAPASFLTEGAYYNRALYALLQSVAAKVNADPVDEAQIVAGVLAGLSPAAIAAAIPADLARQVADELAGRLAA
jgi:hypothetical protein